ncbi:unnamed protein product [Dibothriocephalus latus]|uniref:Endonuclease/exonuclease/phosphatase domain-containing protein n=1 Tax=Dibothriocephalus latus TaxID=60516 RepID=A0A3P7N4V1_DIBLA|nr:unnamed protein product [Dibothriocephalus latus]
MKTEIADSEISIPAYQPFRKDRQNRQGGGVAVYVRTGISVVEREHTQALECESVWLKIKKANSHNLEFLAIYLPPNVLSGADDTLLSLVKEAASHQEVLIVGDFNSLQ